MFSSSSVSHAITAVRKNIPLILAAFLLIGTVACSDRNGDKNGDRDGDLHPDGSASFFGLNDRTQHRQAWSFSGPTMGTRYSIKLYPPTDTPNETSTSGAQPKTTSQVAKASIQANINQILERVNDLMSTYQADSEVSRLNRAAVGQAFALSPETYEVLALSRKINALSEGAFDVTVGPLVELWGFGKGARLIAPPDRSAIEKRLSQVGQEALVLIRNDKAQSPEGAHPAQATHSPPDALPGFLVRKDKAVRVDLSAIAKGYAVDAIAEYLYGLGIQRFLVEIGGEISTAGTKPGDEPWRIALETPEAGARNVHSVLSLSDVAVATSGNYRNFFEFEGRRYGHSINPQTGWPVEHGLVSVTVFVPAVQAQNGNSESVAWQSGTALADAWATALMVAGPERAPRLAQLHQLAVLFIFEDESGRYKQQISEQGQPFVSSGP